MDSSLFVTVVLALAAIASIVGCVVALMNRNRRE